MGRSRYRIFANNQPYFLTCTVVRWLPVFVHPKFTQIILDSLDFMQTENRLILCAYVIMENHLHLIAGSSDLGKEIGDFKSFTARRIIDCLESTGPSPLLRELSSAKRAHKKDRQYQLWQEGSHPKHVQGNEMMRQKIDYIHNNPVRRGYVDNPVDWRYSSARNYTGKQGLLKVTTEW